MKKKKNYGKNLNNMTNEQTLTKAIEKAIENGYNIDPGWVIDPVDNIVWPKTNTASETNSVIFSHDFAKAFWGEEEYKPEFGRDFSLPSTPWQYHLQIMVLEEDPIKYLEKNIKH